MLRLPQRFHPGQIYRSISARRPPKVRNNRQRVYFYRFAIADAMFDRWRPRGVGRSIGQGRRGFLANPESKKLVAVLEGLTSPLNQLSAYRTCPVCAAFIGTWAAEIVNR